MTAFNPQVIIIGAGIAGLMAARTLQEHDVTVQVLEKNKHPGGRMATLILGEDRADIGAQFFTARTPEFQAYVDRWLAEGIVLEWTQGWSDGSMSAPHLDGHARYAAKGGMATIADWLARDVDVRTGVEVRTITAVSHSWQLIDQNNQFYNTNALILTPPVPISLNLLKAGFTTLSTQDTTTLKQIHYAPCLCGVFQIKGTVHLPEPGAIQQPEAAISWIADNRCKDLATNPTITVHAGPEHSRWYWHASNEIIRETLLEALRPYLDTNATIRQSTIIRWPHALPVSLHPEKYYLSQYHHPLVFAGDAFDGPRVEGAFLSGIAAANAILSVL
ncbi:MAG: FAD-dependent oxidoreductase [Chloroflexi bacterium]|nr:MAG: FAD-dependent oxidoreductase [Chloroflexota bacterium]